MLCKSRRMIICICLFLLLFISSSLFAQEQEKIVSRDSLLTVAHAIIDSARCHVFITVDENNKPQAREMSVFPPEADWTLWLGTNPRSRKAKQIKNNPNVMVYYYDTKGYSYVSIAGQARLVTDPVMKKKYWKEGWTRWYPDPEKDYILIQVIPERMEICSFQYQLFWDKDTKPVAIIEF